VGVTSIPVMPPVLTPVGMAMNGFTGFGLTAESSAVGAGFRDVTTTLVGVTTAAADVNAVAKAAAGVNAVAKLVAENAGVTTVVGVRTGKTSRGSVLRFGSVGMVRLSTSTPGRTRLNRLPSMMYWLAARFGSFRPERTSEKFSSAKNSSEPATPAKT